MCGSGWLSAQLQFIQCAETCSYSFAAYVLAIVSRVCLLRVMHCNSLVWPSFGGDVCIWGQTLLTTGWVLHLRCGLQHRPGAGDRQQPHDSLRVPFGICCGRLKLCCGCSTPGCRGPGDDQNVPERQDGQSSCGCSQCTAAHSRCDFEACSCSLKMKLHSIQSLKLLQCRQPAKQHIAQPAWACNTRARVCLSYICTYTWGQLHALDGCSAATPAPTTLRASAV